MRFFWNDDVKLFEMTQLHESYGVVEPILFTYYGVAIGEYFFGVTRAVASIA